MKRPFIILFIVCTLADVSATLIGQQTDYWRGDYACAEEMNPLAAPLLRHHPVTFVLAVSAGTLLYLAIFKRLPAKLGGALLIFASIVHLVGAASWIIRWGIGGYCLLLALFLLARYLLERDWSMFVGKRLPG